jgi:hypothetical protein
MDFKNLDAMFSLSLLKIHGLLVFPLRHTNFRVFYVCVHSTKQIVRLGRLGKPIMGFRYIFGATPAVESASLRLTPFNVFGGRPNLGSPLKFGAAENFMKTFFLPLLK